MCTHFLRFLSPGVNECSKALARIVWRTGVRGYYIYCPQVSTIALKLYCESYGERGYEERSAKTRDRLKNV